MKIAYCFSGLIRNLDYSCPMTMRYCRRLDSPILNDHRSNRLLRSSNIRFRNRAQFGNHFSVHS